MPYYNPPIRDIKFVLHELLGVGEQYALMEKYKDFSEETFGLIVEEAAKFAQEVVQPLNQVGDAKGCARSSTGEVTTPDGFRQAYQLYVQGGWPSLACDSAYGGQDLPKLANSVLYEMLNAANQAWTMYPGLSHGAYECIHAHGTEEQKNIYLPKLVSGHWTGTMCLTESHCGTDLGLLKTRAEDVGGGQFSLYGTKIFISSGEHDLAENIVHLVLARLPGAPKGTKGISLFIVPKFTLDQAGKLGERNKLSCGSLEHKMGIHANATCVMNFDGAIGTLLGEPNKGLQAMFVMMNAARLGVGMQSLGLTDVAYQNSAKYAKERHQMRSLRGSQKSDSPADPIIVHPDVRRMLLTQRAYAEGGRAFSYYVALLIDTEQCHPDEDTRGDAAELVTLLTPIIKAFLTDNAFMSCNEGLQVFGGHGYITEWGMEQFVRDSRINMIYEGTNTVQALDLLGRKVLRDMGKSLKKFGRQIQEFIEEEGVRKEMSEFIDPLADLASKVEKLTQEIGMKAMMNADEVGAAATPYLRILGHLIYAYLFAKMGKIALKELKSGDDFYKAKLATARFYFARLLPETSTLIKLARAGSSNLMALDAELF